MLLEGSADDDNIVEIHEDVRFEFGAENGVEKPLERGRRGVKAEEHYPKLHEAFLQHGERGNRSAVRCQQHLPIAAL